MRLTEEQYAALQAKSHKPVDRLCDVKHRPRPNTALISEAAERKRKTKFNNIRCQAKDGTNFASKLERDYYEDLLLRWAAGDVLWFTRQIPFWLEGGVKYVADFLVVEQLATGQHVRVVDTKGILTPAFRDKRKQMKARYDIDIEVVTR